MLDVVHKESVAVAGDVVESVVTFLDIISAKTLHGRFHALHQVQHAHVALCRKHVEYAGAVAHKVVVVVGQSFHQCPSAHVILLSGSRRAQFGVHHNRLVVGHNHPAAVPLETGRNHIDIVHVGSDGYASQFATLPIEGVNQSGVGQCQHLSANLYAATEEDALADGARLALGIDDGDAR